MSVPNNNAEGAERSTDKETAQFFAVAKGSLAELQTQLEIAAEAGLLAKDTVVPLINEASELARMLGALIAHLRRGTALNSGQSTRD